MHRLLGIETEYGIVVEGLGANDWIAESIALIRAYPGKAAAGWNYRGEDPRRDMRGFTVQNLAQNPDDAQFDAPGVKPMTREEERSDRILTNGARFYNDHGHPEYATPECNSILSVITYDKAGERVVQSAAEARSHQRGVPVTLYKNNTDYHGSSYGTHEGYLMARSVPTETLVQSLLPFFVSRQVFAGAGKCGVENDRSVNPDTFQLSQRADYFAVEASVDTLHNRPVVNTRDEPHATPAKYRRLHVICGDANMSEYATALKMGTTSLVLRMLEEGLEAPVRLMDPVRAGKAISRDVTLKAAVERHGGPPLTAIEIQRIYLAEAQKRLQGESSETDWVLAEWTSILDILAVDPSQAADRLDWAAKYALFRGFREDEGLSWNSAHMQSLDLEYHNTDVTASLYYGLVEAGSMITLVDEKDVLAAVLAPPQDTRAAIRGHFASRFADSVRSIGWNGIAFKHRGQDLLFDMNSLVEDNLQELNNDVRSTETLDAFVEVVHGKPLTSAGLNAK